MPDEACKVCYACESPFSLLRRRHHCRVCGRVFCGACSSRKISGRLYGYSGHVRCCESCFSISKEVEETYVEKNNNNIPIPPAKKVDESSSEIQKKLQMSRRYSMRFSTSILSSRSQYNFFNPMDSGPKNAPSVTKKKKQNARSTLHFLIQEQLHSHNQTAPKLHKIPNVSFWSTEILTLADASTSHLNFSSSSSSDPAQYVRTTIMPGGHAYESTHYPGGVVLPKNVAHRKMASFIPNPRIMLLRASLDFHRGACRLTNLDTLMEQEAEAMAIIVKRIASLNIHVLVVEKAVSGLALQLLLAQNITVLFFVDASALENLSRLTGALVLSSADHITSTFDPTGTCDLFHVKTLPYISSHAYFEGGRAHLGAPSCSGASNRRSCSLCRAF